jgi:hypothetical protein
MPDLQVAVVEIDPGPDWYKRYTKIKTQFHRSYRGALPSAETQTGIIRELRNMTRRPKVEALAQLIADSCQASTLVYTYHRDLAGVIGELLHIPIVTGDLSPNAREDRALKQGQDFLVATMSSVGEGANYLARYENIIYAEHDWVPGLLEQSLNRVWRPNNTLPTTFVYHLIVRNTIDAIIYNAAQARGATQQEIFNAAIAPLVGEADSDADEGEPN